MENREREYVKEFYGEIARSKAGSGCCCDAGCSCDAEAGDAGKLGYSEEELASIPGEAEAGLSCGNPVQFAAPAPGETVVDLGSGPGKDCFISAHRVGAAGRVIGVDMTGDMLELANRNNEAFRAQSGLANVEFRQGYIEELPVADAEADAVISNCVINLSTEKEKVFREIFRVLKPGGRLVVSDIVLKGELPESIRNDMKQYASCIAGAALKDVYLSAINAAGFQRIEILRETSYGSPSGPDDVYALVASVIVRAYKTE